MEKTEPPSPEKNKIDTNKNIPPEMDIGEMAVKEREELHRAEAELERISDTPNQMAREAERNRDQPIIDEWANIPFQDRPAGDSRGNTFMFWKLDDQIGDVLAQDGYVKDRTLAANYEHFRSRYINTPGNSYRGVSGF